MITKKQAATAAQRAPARPKRHKPGPKERQRNREARAAQSAAADALAPSISTQRPKTQWELDAELTAARIRSENALAERTEQEAREARARALKAELEAGITHTPDTSAADPADWPTRTLGVDVAGPAPVRDGSIEDLRRVLVSSEADLAALVEALADRLTPVLNPPRPRADGACSEGPIASELGAYLRARIAGNRQTFARVLDVFERLDLT